jgi:hypothetical protein
MPLSLIVATRPRCALVASSHEPQQARGDLGRKWIMGADIRAPAAREAAQKAIREGVEAVTLPRGLNPV